MNRDSDESEIVEVIAHGLDSTTSSDIWGVSAIGRTITMTCRDEDSGDLFDVSFTVAAITTHGLI